eukprot:Gb_29790 [translate_table: standard]
MSSSKVQVSVNPNETASFYGSDSLSNMMCKYELGSLRGPPTACVTMTENRMETQTEDGGSILRVKFLCSFGGSILPRPSDGRLRYAGGETRIVSLNRDIGYSELMSKMRELYDQALTLKYQQPDDDLDALVSVLCDEDVCNMMEEYDKLEASDGFTRLRLFLFSGVEHNFPSVDGNEKETEQRYVDALNGVPELNKSENTVAGNGIEAGIAQHVSTALPVSSMQPFFQVGSLSPPSSPSHHRQSSVHDQYYQDRSRKLTIHHQYVPGNNHNMPQSQHDSYPEVPGAPVVEFPAKGQSEINTAVHPGIVLNRDYRHTVVEAYATSGESHGIPLQFEHQHVDVQSEIEVSELGNDDLRIPDLTALQYSMHNLALPQQQHIPVGYHQAVGHCFAGAYNNREHVYSDHHHELTSTDTLQKMPFLHSWVRQAEQAQHFQNANESERGVYHDHENLYKDHHLELAFANSLQKKPSLRPLVAQAEEQQHSQNMNETDRSWNASYYATGPQVSHDFSTLSSSGPVLDYLVSSAPLVQQSNIGIAHEKYLENHHHMQVHWAGEEYRNRTDYSSTHLSGNLTPSNPLPTYNSHILGNDYIMWNQQPPFAGRDARFQGQNLNELPNTIEGNSVSQRLYAGAQLRHNLSEVWSSNSFHEHLATRMDRYGSDKACVRDSNQGGEYFSVIPDELSSQNAGPRVDQRIYPIEQTESHTGFQDGLDETRGWALHQTNTVAKELRMHLDGQTNGIHAPEESMHKDIGQNSYREYYSRCYCSVHPDDSYHVPPGGDFYKQTTSKQYEPQKHMPFPAESEDRYGNVAAIHGRENFPRDLKVGELANASQSMLQHMTGRAHIDFASGVNLPSNNGITFGPLRAAEERGPNVLFGKRDGQNIERMECSYTSCEINAADVVNVPDYMSDDIFRKDTNTSDDDDRHFMGSQYMESEGIKFFTAESVKGHTNYQSGTPTACASNVFVTVGSNEIHSGNAFSCDITSSIKLPDRLTPSSFEVLPSVLSSSPPKDNISTPVSLPIYDQSPANSTNVTVPEDLWSENDTGRKFHELETKDVSDNNRITSVPEQQAAELNANDLEVPRKAEDMDNRMHENCLNDAVDADICSTSRPLHPPVQCTTLSSSSINSASKIMDKQVSTSSAKELVYMEDKDEVMLPLSDAEENLPKKETPESPVGLDEDSGSDSGDMANSISAEAEKQALAQGLQTVRNADLEEIRELGSGTYGTVYHGKWKGSDVAIKRIKASCFAGRPSERERLIADFWKEASILGQLHHPNVVSFYGVVRDGPDGTLATVTEFMVNGSLKQVLHKKDRTIDRRKRLIIAMDAAFGMEYLHGKNIVHFDLKCENLLVNMRDPHRPVCKIGDMGLSKVKHQTLVSGGVRGTLPWMAPELLSGKSGMVTDKVDVYSFGIVMWELLTGDEPYANMHCGSIIGGIMNNTLRPPIPSWCDPAWRSLMERCWSFDPMERPPFSDIAKELRAVAASINLK